MSCVHQLTKVEIKICCGHQQRLLPPEPNRRADMGSNEKEAPKADVASGGEEDQRRVFDSWIAQDHRYFDPLAGMVSNVGGRDSLSTFGGSR